MCRLFGFRSRTPLALAYPLLDAPNALIKQSKCDSRQLSHPDGWGIGYYREGEAVVHKNVAPAYEDAVFREQARRLSATTAIAHVRAASVGNITLQNAHPFRYQNWLWAHNGTVRPFDEIYASFCKQIDPQFLALRQGQTDSEMCFLLFLTELAKLAPSAWSHPPPELAVESMRRTVQKILTLTQPFILPKPPALTFLATNGETLLAFRYVSTLFLSHASENFLKPLDKQTPLAVVASEPLNEAPWQEIMNGHCVVVEANLKTEILDFGFGDPLPHPQSNPATAYQSILEPSAAARAG